jgi:MOSC domain-containing protein YiiM
MFQKEKCISINDKCIRVDLRQIGKEPGESHPYHYRGFSLLPRFGVFARVVESGTVKNGDEVELLNSFP